MRYPCRLYLEVLGSKYANWKKDLSILPPESIVISELYRQNLRLPLPFFHYFFAIHDIHPLQLSTNSIRAMNGFILLSLIKYLGLGIFDFYLCYVRVQSSKYFISSRKGQVCFLGIPSKDSDPKNYFLLSGNQKSPYINHSIFPIHRSYNFGK